MRRHADAVDARAERRHGSYNVILWGKTALKRLLATALAPLALLAACGPKAEAPAAPAEPTETRTVATSVTPTPAVSFQHDPAVDLTGFYFTETPVKAGQWALTSLDIGQPSDFVDWEAGKRQENYGPIFLALDDVTSPTGTNELGQTYHQVSLRLMPERYSVDARKVVFRAKDARLGEVVLDLSVDLAAYKAARADGPQGAAARPVLSGNLQLGAQRFSNLTFFYNPGD